MAKKPTVVKLNGNTPMELRQFITLVIQQVIDGAKGAGAIPPPAIKMDLALGEHRLGLTVFINQT